MFPLHNETLDPSRQSLRHIDAVGGQIRPACAELSDWYRNYLRDHRVRLAFDADLVSWYASKNAKLLEVGSIPLLLTGALRRMGYEVCGVDLAPERFQAAIALLDIAVRKCNVEQERLPFPDASFDLVVFNEIFEHLRINPIFTLGEVLRTMRSGARLLLSTPNLRSLDGILNFLVRSRASACVPGDLFDEYAKLERLGHMGHVREYTGREVCDFLRRVGFAIERVHHRGGYRSRTKAIASNLFASLRPALSVVAIKNGSGKPCSAG